MYHHIIKHFFNLLNKELSSLLALEWLYLFLAVTCQDTRIFCWKHTLLLGDSVSGPAGVFITPSCMPCALLSAV